MLDWLREKLNANIDWLHWKNDLERPSSGGLHPDAALRMAHLVMILTESIALNIHPDTPYRQALMLSCLAHIANACVTDHHGTEQNFFAAVFNMISAAYMMGAASANREPQCRYPFDLPITSQLSLSTAYNVYITSASTIKQLSHVSSKYEFMSQPSSNDGMERVIHVVRY